MKAKEFVGSMPQKSFQTIFNEKENLLIELNVAKDAIDYKRRQYHLVFLFDEKIKELNDLFKNNGDYDLSAQEVKKINSYLSDIRTISSWLHNLDLSNPLDIENVFKNFSEKLFNSKYLKNIQVKIGNEEIYEDTVLESYIEQLEIIIKFIELSVLSNRESLNDLEETFKNISDNISEADNIANDFLKNKDKFEEAKKSADNWLASLDKSLSATLNKRSLTFSKKAGEHKTFSIEYVSLPFGFKLLKNFRQPSFSGKFYWLITAFTFACVSFALVTFFILELKDKSDINLGVALLRISSLIIPSYLAYFCLQQYVNHKKLYESYNYRDIALNTMKELLRERSRDEEQSEILNRGMGIIFSEPALNDANNQKQIVEDLKEIIIKKLSK